METASPENPTAGPHILLLQQDPAEAKALEKLLKEKGCRVTISLNGNAAYSQLADLKPDILMSDLIVPDLDGPSLTIRLKNEERFRSIQVILLTRASNLGDLLEVLTCNADAFLPKPIDSNYVSTLIEYLMSNKAVPQIPEPVQTQFRVAYDGNEYSLLTGRRKLLDFLLSSYEIMGIRVSETEDLQNRIENLSQKITDLEQEHNQKIESAVTILNQDIAGLNSTIGKLQESVTERDRQIEALRSQSRIFEHQVKTKSSEAGELQISLSNAANEKKELEDRILALQSELDTKLTEIESLRTDLAASQTALEQESEKVRISEEQKETALKQAVSEKKELEDRIFALQSEIETKLTDIESLKNNLSTTQDSLEMKESTLAQTTSEKKELEDRILTLQSDLDAKISLIESLNNNLSSTQVSLGEETQRSADLENTLTEVKKSLSERDNVLLQKEEHLEKEKQDSARQIQELEEIIATQEEDLKEAQRAAESARDAAIRAEQTITENAESAKRNIENLSENIRQKEAELEQSKQMFTQKQSALTEQIQSLQSEITKITEDLKGRSMAEEIARAALADREKRETVLRQQVKELETSLAEKENLLTQNTANLDAAKKESSSIGEQLATLTRDLADKVQTVASLEKSLDEERTVRSSAETRAFAVAQEKEDAEARAGSLAREFERMAGRVADLEAVIGTRDETIRTLSQEIEDLKRKQAMPLVKPEPVSSEEKSAAPKLAESIPTSTSMKEIPSQPESSQEPETPEKIPEIISREPAIPQEILKNPLPEMQTATHAEDSKSNLPNQIPQQSITTVPQSQVPIVMPQMAPKLMATPDEMDTSSEIDIHASTPVTITDSLSGSNQEQWTSIADWAHRNGKLSPQERGHLVIMGRLARKGKEPTSDQIIFAREILERAKSAGYQSGN